MDRKSEIYQLWNIQEGLLQQYRMMSISLLGLISAGILVLISFLLDEDHKKNFQNDSELVNFILISMYAVLLFLGAYGTFAFNRISNQRARLVTFFQNMLIAEESGKLNQLISEFSMEENIPFMYILRRAGAKSPNEIGKLPIERDYKFDILGFIASLDLRRSEKGQWIYRHYWARRFLYSFIFRVFGVFFMLCFCLLAIVTYRYFRI